MRDITEGFTREQYLKHGVHFEELSETSILLKKKIKEAHDGDMSMLQLAFSNHAIVYNLQSENRYEVALIHDIETFTDPI